jgi:excinuclease ABC subunit C
LDRSDDAALHTLEVRRDEAAAKLLFETAATIQAELEGLAWVVAPQRVTVDGAGDLKLTGRGPGLDLTLMVRDGRLCEWKQLRGIRRTPEVGVPAGWEQFVRRNVSLAVELSAAQPDPG